MSSILKVDQIQNSNGTAGLTINTNGYVIMPQRPAFFARAGTAYSQTGTIKYNNVTGVGCFNQGGHFSTATHKFTAPCDGIYTFSNQVYAEGANQTNLYFYLNNDVIAGQQQNQAADDQYEGIMLTATVKMSAGDTVYYSTSTSIHHTNASFSFFSGHLVG